MLKKLSLAALIAMGSMSVASATPLTEAIKGVDFSGYTRLRVYNDTQGVDKTRYRTSGVFKFAVPVSENLKFMTAYSFDWNIYSNDTAISGSAAPANSKMFLKYTNNGLTAIAGKIPVNTPVTGSGLGEATAAGAIATYKISDNLTAAAGFLDHTVNLDQLPGTGTSKNIATAAVIYTDKSFGGVQVWYFNVENAIDSDIVVSADLNVLKDQGVALHADFATASLTNDAETAFGVSGTQTYYNVSAAYSKDAVSAKVGYTATGKDGGVVVLDGDSPIAAVLPTEQKTGIANTVDDYAFYAKVGYKVDAKTNVFVAYSDADKAFDNEIVVEGSYAYTKKMNISAYYSIGSKVINGNTDNNEARVEFKYSF